MRKQQQVRRRRRVRERQQARQALRRPGMGRWREVYSISVHRAHYAREFVELVDRANARGDWQAAGCSSSEEWVVQVLSHAIGDVTVTLADQSEAAPRVDELDSQAL